MQFKLNPIGAHSATRVFRKHIVSFASVGLLAILAGCGGGGGGGSSADARETTAAVPTEENPDVLVQAGFTDVTNVVTSPTQSGLEAQPSVSSQPPQQTQTQEPVALRSEDVIVNLRAGQPGELLQGRIQCMGQNVTASSVPGGVYGTGVGGLTELKHGVVDDTTGANTQNKAFYFKLWKNDPATSGVNAQRCERYFAASGQTIPQDADVWFGVRLKASEWDTSTGRIVWQWHEDSDTSGLLPHLAAIVNGRNLRIVAQYNDNPTLSRANTTPVVLFSTNQWQPGVWHDFVIKAKVDPRSDGAGYVEAWLNGVKVINYQGPLGYRYDDVRDYAKIGIYHWNTTSNQWRSGETEELTASYSGMVLMRHHQSYTPEFIRSLLQ